MKRHDPPTLVILGGGASGALVATHLLRLVSRPVRILLVEKGGCIARGVAYATSSPSHLLNVPAGRMSALADDPSHFVRWLACRRPEEALGELDFVPRLLYGEYLRATLEEALAGASSGTELELRADEGVGLEVHEDHLLAHFRESPSVVALGATIALGNSPPADPSQVTRELVESGRWRSDPWAPGSLDGIGREDVVFLLGTGLTAVDMVLALDEAGHRGPIVALSRRGLLPHAHRRGTSVSPWEPPAGAWPRSVRGWSRALRARARSEDREGCDGWRGVIDGLRKITPRIWSELPPEEKRRLLRHLLPYWDAHRHRMAPQVAERIDALRSEGRFTRVAGRLADLRPTAAGLEVRWRVRGGRMESVGHEVVAAINCTGPSFARGAAESVLLRDLLAHGTARLDRLGLGLDATAEGALLSAAGVASDRVWTLGPPLKGVLWETIAIPEIRAQALQVAEQLVALRG